MARSAPPDFDLYVAVDWSGARGQAHSGIAVAAAVPGQAPPMIVPPPDGNVWSRGAVLDWLAGLARSKSRVIAGFDFSFALPFVDAGAYLPGVDAPCRAPALWALVDEVCTAEPDLYAGSFTTTMPYADHFRAPGARGRCFAPRLRVTEEVCRSCGLGRAESVFHLVGPAQVGLASLAGMRLLHRLSRVSGIAVWPFDAPHDTGLTVVELYTRIFLNLAGCGAGKVRDGRALHAALSVLGTTWQARSGTLSDHETDVLIAVAGLRQLAGQNDPAARLALWNPPALSSRVRSAEGWTWGVP